VPATADAQKKKNDKTTTRRGKMRGTIGHASFCLLFFFIFGKQEKLQARCLGSEMLSLNNGGA
jgi:hypothetical protein